MTNPPSTPDGTIPEPPSGAPNPAGSSPTWGTPAAPAGGPQAQYPPPGQAQLPPQGQAQYPPAAASAVKNPLLKRIIVIVSTEGGTISGKVKAVVKGGLLVNVGVEAFLPASQIDIIPPKDLNEYVGNVYEFKILKIVPGTTDDSQCPAETTITYTEQAKAGQTSSKDRMVCLTTK